MKKRMGYRWGALAGAALLALGLTACEEKKTEPVTVSLWHVYGGEVDSPLNVLVDEFNATVGREQGVRVESLARIQEMSEETGVQFCE